MNSALNMPQWQSGNRHGETRIRGFDSSPGPQWRNAAKSARNRATPTNVSSSVSV
jgi:hypothetical protein